MSIFYSAATGGFYSADIHGTAIPADAVEIAAELHAALLIGQAEGKRIVAGPGGPVLQDRPKPSDEEILAAEREGMLCSRFQARAALHLAGLLPAAEAVVAAADGLVQIAWADATQFRRDSPMIVAIGQQLALTPEQIDDLFRQAMTITA